MAWGLWPDLSVEITRRRLRYVADPYLCLTEAGAVLLHGLSAHAEVWLGPEFLNILDGWTHYDREPEHLLAKESRSGNGADHATDGIRNALQLWLHLREDTTAARLYWVRDAVRDSRLPPDIDESVLPRWEAISEALDERLSRSDTPSGPMVAAVRDAVALAALLPGALLLTARPPRSNSLPPLCRELEAWHLDCRRLDYRDDLVTMERGLMLQTLIEAGLAGSVWSGMRLAIVHLDVPGRARLPHTRPDLATPEEDAELLADVAPPRPVRGVWEDARAFWYDLVAEE